MKRKDNKKIARVLNISLKVVQYHLKKLKKQLNFTKKILKN